jgi:hypothetical protein
MKQKWPIIECSTIGRPLRGHEGSERIAELFGLPCMQEFIKQDVMQDITKDVMQDITKKQDNMKQECIKIF